MLTPSLNTVMTRLLAAAALLAALALAVAFIAPAASAQGGPMLVKYAENGTGSVITFTSTDPEGGGIDWDVTGIDADDFAIDPVTGELRFATPDPPNFEAPTDRLTLIALDINGNGNTSNDDGSNPCEPATTADSPSDNCYRIVVRATEQKTSGSDPRALSTETVVVVQVTNVNEDGTVTMDLLQPEVGTPITASVSDPDGTVGPDSEGNATTVAWQWFVSKVSNPVATTEGHWIAAAGAGSNAANGTYTPAGVRVSPNVSNDATNDADKYLRARATYTDSHGVQRVIYGVSVNMVRAEVPSDSDEGITNPANGSPGFSSAGDYTRSVSESAPVGSPVGAAVTALDPNSDTLTYELDNDRTATGNPNPGTATAPADYTYFSINPATGQLSVKKKLSAEATDGRSYDGDNPPTAGKYMFYVRATDPSNETAEVEVTVTATDANDAPKIMGSKAADAGVDVPTPDAPSELRVNEKDDDAPATYTGGPDLLLLGKTGSGLGAKNVFTAQDEDPRGQIFWTLEGIDADVFALSSSSDQPNTGLSGPDEPIALRFKEAPDYEKPTDSNKDSVYKVTMVATDSSGGVDRRPLTVFVDNVNEQGEVTLSSGQPLNGTPITATVEDPDNGVAVVSWQWLKTESLAPTATSSVILGATSGTYTPGTADNNHYLVVRAVYTDMTSMDDDSSTVNIDERTQKAGPAAQVPNANTATDKTYRVSATSTNAVRVDPAGPGTTKPAPEFASDSYDRDVAENSEYNSLVGAPVTAIAEKGVTFEYNLDATVTKDNEYFTIDTATGQIRVGQVTFPDPIPAGVSDTTAAKPTHVDPTLDYEGVRTFELVVTAEDKSTTPSRKATATVNVALIDLNEAPYFDKDSRGRTTATTEDPNNNRAVRKTKVIQYSETRTNEVIRLSAIDPDASTPAGSLRWDVIGPDAADFYIKQDDDIAGSKKDRVELHFKSQPDFENPTDRAVDLNNNGATTDANEPAGDNIYEITVRATETTSDGADCSPVKCPAKSAELDVTVQVTNTDVAGSVSFDLLRVDSNYTNDGKANDATITAIVSDPDSSSLGTPTYTWYRAKVSGKPATPNPGSAANPPAALLQVWQPTGQTGASYAPSAADEGKHLLARASYQEGGQGPTKYAVGVTAYPVRKGVSDNANNSPDFSSATATRLIDEDTAVGMPVGAPVVVDVNEDGDRLTYSLDNDTDTTNAVTGDATFFSISATSGQIMVDKKLSAEETDGRTYTGDGSSTAGKYVFYVRATDPSGETALDENRDEIEVTVTADNVNEAPSVTDGRAELFVREADSSNKNEYFGLEYRLNPAPNLTNAPDNPINYYWTGSAWGAKASAAATTDNLYHREEEDVVDRAIWPEPIAGPDGGLFEYSVPEDGIGRRLHFKSKPDFENPMDADGDNVYVVRITVRDEAGLEGQKTVRITVLNVDETGTLSLSPEQPDSGMPLVATVNDPDSPNGVVVTDWEWEASTTTVDRTQTAQWYDVDNTTGSHTGTVGEFLWVQVDYRDGASVEDDPVTVLDERNDNPDTTATEQHKTSSDDPNVVHNSDEVLSDGSANAVQPDPDPDNGGTTGPSTKDEEVSRDVYENVPSTGYVGMPLTDLLDYKAGGADYVRDAIGGPDGNTFVFAEDVDGSDVGYYDPVLAPSTDIPNDKKAQLALKTVTHLDYETKKTYIVEISDPNAVVAVGAVKVTINVLDVNEAPTAPEELRGPPPVRNVAPDFAATTTTRTVAENMATGTPVGAPVSATDADDDPITYSLGTTTDDMAFDISTSTGQISTKAPLDYETKSSYSVTVTATDDDDASSSIMVTIMVTDVGLTNAYDVDESGVIESDEVLQAVADYFAGTINQTQVLEVVALYFAGLPTGS